ncbi:MAG TPA: hypothetical protein PK400_00670 [Phycisphaerales bacterium]|nr:hypothetical protein [Phycisphaerales bacterium]
MQQARQPAMTIANDQTIAEMIRSATQRVVYLAPGCSEVVAAALADQWRLLGTDAVTVIVDVDAEICRLGYGSLDALRSLKRIARAMRGMVHAQPGVRIGLVIADEQTLIFAPTPLLIETGPAMKDATLQPKAVRLGLPPADLERDLGLGADGISEQIIGLDKASHEQIEALAESLAANPPQTFDIARKVRVFNARFEFVELSVKGLAIDRKRVEIPSDLMGIGGEVMQDALRMSLSLINQRDSLALQRFQRARAYIKRTYLVHLPGFGYIVSMKDKPKLVSAVKKLERIAMKLYGRACGELQAELDMKKQEMQRLLLPLVHHNRPKRWFHPLRERNDVGELLSVELKRLFGEAYKLLGRVEVRLVFKAVTYEMLTDPAFIKLVGKRRQQVGPLHDERDVAMSIDPAARQHHQPPLKGAA